MGNSLLSRPVMLALAVCGWLAGCGSKEKDASPPPRKVELRLNVAGTQPYASGQRLPTAYVLLWGSNKDYLRRPFYAQESPNGSYVALTLTDLPADTRIDFVGQFKSLGGAPLTPSGTTLQAGVYLDGVLQQELVLDNAHAPSQNTGCSGTGASEECEVSSYSVSCTIH